MAQDVDISASLSSLISPPTGQIAIAANDVLSRAIRGFAVDVTGNVAVVFVDGTTGQYTGCVPGAIYSGCIKQVIASGTDSKGNAVSSTATGIRGFY